jgi:hypothetical protein
MNEFSNGTDFNACNTKLTISALEINCFFACASVSGMISAFLYLQIDLKIYWERLYGILQFAILLLLSANYVISIHILIYMFICHEVNSYAPNKEVLQSVLLCMGVCLFFIYLYFKWMMALLILKDNAPGFLCSFLPLFGCYMYVWYCLLELKKDSCMAHIKQTEGVGILPITDTEIKLVFISELLVRVVGYLLETYDKVLFVLLRINGKEYETEKEFYAVWFYILFFLVARCLQCAIVIHAIIFFWAVESQAAEINCVDESDYVPVIVVLVVALIIIIFINSLYVYVIYVERWYTNGKSVADTFNELYKLRKFNSFNSYVLLCIAFFILQEHKNMFLLISLILYFVFL